MKRFVVYTEASPADPTHQIALSIIGTDGTTHAEMGTVDLLIESAFDVERSRAESAGFQKGIDYACKLLGVSKEEFVEKLKGK